MNEQTFLQWLVSIGSPAQIALFGLALITLLKIWPILQKNVMDAREAREGRYEQRISHLEIELARCHEECEEKIKALDEQLHGMRDQRTSEQIAMMRAILQTVEDPNLRKQLEMLEALNMTVVPATYVGGPITDKETGGE